MVGLEQTAKQDVSNNNYFSSIIQFIVTCPSRNDCSGNGYCVTSNLCECNDRFTVRVFTNEFFF